MKIVHPKSVFFLKKNSGSRIYHTRGLRTVSRHGGQDITYSLDISLFPLLLLPLLDSYLFHYTFFSMSKVLELRIPNTCSIHITYLHQLITPWNIFAYHTTLWRPVRQLNSQHIPLLGLLQHQLHITKLLFKHQMRPSWDPLALFSTHLRGALQTQP